MQNRIYYTLIATAFLTVVTGCSKGMNADPDTVTIALLNTDFLFAEDGDNLAVEQTIKNISVFFTLPGDNTITHNYSMAGFVPKDDYQLVMIPLNGSELKYRDIYVVTNYNNSSLNSISTISDLAAKTTPVLSKNKNLDPAEGICMFGQTLNFNFESGLPARVYAIRTCAKYRITLRFPQDPGISTSNFFVINDAPTYTYIMESGSTQDVPTFNFPKYLPLDDTGNESYQNITYVYEAISKHPPKLYINTEINGPNDPFWEWLPVPRRNYLYDINAYIYRNPSSRNQYGEPEYSCRFDITTYDESGNIVE